MILPLLLAILLLGGLPASAASQGRSLRLASFHADVTVEANGDIDVVETLRPHFTGSWNGVYRNLSLQHHTARGTPRRLDVEMLSITDGEGNDLRVERSSPDSWTRRFQIWVPGAEDATRTVVLHYRVDNAIRFFESESDPGGVHDELYWNATGNAWEIPIDRASVTVTLPEGTAVSEAYAYTGPEGSTARDADVTTDGNRAEAVARNSLSAGSGLTFSVSWPPGVVARPSAISTTAEEVHLFWPVVLPVLALLFMVRMWMRRGRDPKARAIVVQYDPPEGLSPAEVGTLVDHRAEIHDITSTLVDLAVRGYIRIEEEVEKHFFGLKTDRDYAFERVKPRSEWGDLKLHERRFLTALFGSTPLENKVREMGVGKFVMKLLKSGMNPEEAFKDEDEPADGEPRPERIELSDLSNKFYKALSGIRDAIYDRLVSTGHYLERPDKVKGRYTGLAVVTAMGGVGAFALLQKSPVFLAHPAFLLGGFLGAALMILVVGIFMPARTEKGARAREAALGFKEFLNKVEEPRYRRMIKSPEDFERFLPYAMAFQVEERWAEAFEDIYTEPPSWYVGSNPARGFHAGDFTSRLSSMSHQASSTFSSSPSGSGGGGSSGGGSGGGGGGGF